MSDRRRSTRASVGPDGGLYDMDREFIDSTTKVYQLWELLLNHSEIQLEPEQVSTVLLALHWWGDVVISHPMGEIPKEKLKSALQRLSRAALEHFAITYNTPGWLQKLPTEHKNAFAINVFGLEKQWHSQALELILPAFSVFKEKDYCLILQPPSAPVLPFMRYFSAEKKKPKSSFSQLLFVLHRQALLVTPLFRPLRESDTVAVTEKAAAVGVRLSQEALDNAVEDADNATEVSSGSGDQDVTESEASSQPDNDGSDGRSNSDRSSEAPASQESYVSDQPADHFVVVGTVSEEVVAIAEVRSIDAAELKDLLLKYHLEPYLLHGQRRKQQEVRDLLEERRERREAKRKLRRLVVAPIEEIEQDEQIDDKLNYDAFGGHAVLSICLIDASFQFYVPLLLREVMRLAGAKLLHTVIEPTGPASSAFYHFFPVKPKAVSAIKYLDAISPHHGYFASADGGGSSSSPDGMPGPERITASIIKRRATVQEALQHFEIHEASLIRRTEKREDVTLLAPGGLPLINHEAKPLLSQSTTDYDEPSEIRRLLIDLRVRVVDRRITRIDRKRGQGAPGCFGLSRNGLRDDRLGRAEAGGGGETGDSFFSGVLLPYDFLILATGMQDSSLQEIGVRSWGLDDVHDLCEESSSSSSALSIRKVDGCISSADPRLHDLLDEKGPYLVPLRWNPLTSAVVYGRSLDAYCLVHALLHRDVPAQKITLVLPP
ncbi:hypothetical protein CSUI_001260, partial [Cystoisospora suis]